MGAQQPGATVCLSELHSSQWTALVPHCPQPRVVGQRQRRLGGITSLSTVANSTVSGAGFSLFLRVPLANSGSFQNNLWT